MKKIKIGLLVDDLLIPFWAFKMIENIITSDYAEISLVVKKKCSAPKRSPLSNKNENFKFLFYKLYKIIEHKFFKRSPDAFELKNLAQIINTTPVLQVDCIEKTFSDYIGKEDIVKITQFEVDVFIRLGFRILRGDILKIAKWGVWSYHHGDNFVNRGGPAGFWEVFTRKRDIGSILQILTEDLDGGKVLYRSWSTVHRLQLDTLNLFYWKTSRFIPRKLKELFETGEEEFFDKLKKENNQLNFYSDRLFTTPDNVEFSALFIKHFWDWLNLNLWKFFNFEQWMFFYSFNNKNEPATSIFRYKRITPPNDRSWCDPFVIFENEKYYIFFEELVYKGNQKGHISAMEIDSNGICSSPKIILKTAYHLSYPFIFKHENEYYLIPESEENSNIQLYVAINFPYEWEFKTTLMDNVKAVDTTILFKNNKFWLFTNIVEIEGAPYSEELFLFSSDSLFSKQWQAHPGNPIVSDVKSARPAGRLFYHNEKLYRPSQDCSYKYGYATIINEVLVINEKEYKEDKVSDISPNWAKDVLATHTLSFDKNLTVIDAAIKRRKPFF